MRRATTQGKATQPSTPPADVAGVADVIALPLSSVQGKEVIFGSISFPLASLVCFSQSTRVPPFCTSALFPPCE